MLDSKRRGRRKGVEVRPGSVLEARKEAGLTLAQVAGGVVSRAAIHLVETGQTRPSFETLEMIARRTNKPIEFFLADGQAVPQLGDGYQEIQELARLTATGDLKEVVDRAHRSLDKPWNRESRALLWFYLGQAFCRLFQPPAALDHLANARRMFEELGDEWMAVESMDWEACAMWQLDDPNAISQALQALERCRRLHPRSAPTEARILGHLAGMHISAHSWTQAMRYYEAALEAAGAVKDLMQLARMHHGLGTVYQRLNRPAQARQHFEKALALYSLESDLSAIYRVENDVGELLLRLGHIESAESHLRKALAGSSELGVDRKGRGYVLTNLAEVALKKGNANEASGLIREAIELGEAAGERLVVANANVVQAEIEEGYGSPEQADSRFAAALLILEQLAMPDRLREGHMRYAELLEARGDIAGAAAHWRSAAEIGRFKTLGAAASERAAESVNQAIDA
jgi:tetratricopeptide (TPR) repeat protein